MARKKRILRDEFETAWKEAEYLASPKGLAIETIKGIPKATKKILGFLLRPLPYSTPWLMKKEKEYKERK